MHELKNKGEEKNDLSKTLKNHKIIIERNINRPIINVAIRIKRKNTDLRIMKSVLKKKCHILKRSTKKKSKE